MSYLAVILVLGLLILVHEAGHFAAAKAVGIPVARFSIGFGRVLWSRTYGDTEYRVSLIPVGGYVMPRIKSEADYLAVPLYKRVVFSLGGPVANVALALPLFAIMNALNGNTSLYALVVGPFIQIGHVTAQIVAAFASIFSRPDAVSGVVGIVAGGGKFVGMSLARLVLFAAIVDMNLAVLNLLPLPPLDGGKITLDALERLFPRTRRAYVPIVLVGWLFIIGLMLYATAMDVSKIAA